MKQILNRLGRLTHGHIAVDNHSLFRRQFLEKEGLESFIFSSFKALAEKKGGDKKCFGLEASWLNFNFIFTRD